MNDILGCLQAVLLRILFKIDIMQEADNAPVFRILPEAKLPGIPFHDRFHRKGMLLFAAVLVVLHRLFSPTCKPERRFIGRDAAFPNEIYLPDSTTTNSPTGKAITAWLNIPMTAYFMWCQ